MKRLWAHIDNSEVLHEDLDDAVHDFLDDYTNEVHATDTEVFEAYVQNEPTEDAIEYLASVVATRFLEDLHEDDRLGGDLEAGGYPKPTKVHLEAARTFVRAVLSDWTVFWCHKTGEKRTVKLIEYVEHR
jgi:hypothetical protein